MTFRCIGTYRKPDDDCKAKVHHVKLGNEEGCGGEMRNRHKDQTAMNENLHIPPTDLLHLALISYAM